MPTGYTAELMETDGVTFEQFVLRCARAFGALILMRDDPLDAPIPEKFEPSNYYETALVKAREEYANLQSLNPDEKLAFGKRRVEELRQQYQKAIDRERIENGRLDAMRQKVVEWIYPSGGDYIGLKKFMLEQIDMSRHNVEYFEEKLAEVDSMSFLALYDDAVLAAARRAETCEQSRHEEIQRTEERNLWVSRLRENLKNQPA